MGRILTPAEIAGPFAGVFMDNIFLYGKHNDQGAILSNATITTQATPLNDADPDVFGRVYVSNAGNITGVIMQAGRYDHQMISVINYGSGTVTMAAVGTSNVLGGTAIAIPVNQGMTFLWIVATNINGGVGCWVNT